MRKLLELSKLLPGPFWAGVSPAHPLSLVAGVKAETLQADIDRTRGRDLCLSKLLAMHKPGHRQASWYAYVEALYRSEPVIIGFMLTKRLPCRGVLSAILGVSDSFWDILNKF